MEELDVVKLIENYENILAGTEGAIVLDYGEELCEVEFFDKNGDTIDVVTTPKKLLEVVWEFKE